MQINTYQINKINQIFGDSKSGIQDAQSIQKGSFFDVVVDKMTQGNGINSEYLNYGKDGLDNQKQTNHISGYERKQELLDYVKQNLEKLQELVTTEDYSAMSELGLAPDKENPDTLVTVYERIQIQLAAYCDDYNYKGSSISNSKIESVLGSKAMAQALEMKEQSGEFNDAAKAYLLKNGLEPTIQNVYKATHSTSAGAEYAVSKMSKDQWNDLKPQIENMMENAGMEVTKEGMANAKWLVENQIPVTVENLVKLDALNQVDMNRLEVITSNVAFAVMLGMDGTEAYVTEEWIRPNEIADAQRAIQNVSDETLYAMVEDNAVLNVANIQKYESETQQNTSEEKQEDADYEKAAFVKAKSVIVEARLVMTSGAFLNMQKVGINITYSEISLMVTATKTDTQDYFSSFVSDQVLNQQEVAKHVEAVMDVMKSMSQIPSAVMGGIYSEKIEFQLSSIKAETTYLEANFSKAELTYEAVGTQVRTDLGDSINKAFQSIEDILKAQNIEITEGTKRATRILAHNQLEINETSVLKMQSLLEELDYVRDNLTPKTAAYLAENQVDILNTDIRDLNKYLEELNELIGVDDTEDFAKYLWKLEKKGDISEENRERYIELYRTLNMVESGDARAIGAVTASGVSFTLNNLLSAVKSRQKSGMEVTVDDQFGLNENVVDEQSAFHEEIGSFVKKLAAKIKHGLNVENIEKVYKEGAYREINFGNLVDIVSDQESLRQNQSLNGEYIKKIMDTYMQEIATEGISEDTILSLLEGGQNATVENVMSALEWATPGSQFRKYLMDKENEKVRQAAENVLEQFESEESAEEAVHNLKEAATLESKEAEFIDMNYEKMRAMADVNRNLRFMVRSVENKCYHLPMEIGGEAVSVRVSMVHEEGAGSVYMSMNTATFGKIDCSIQSVNTVSGVRSEAVVYCESSVVEGHIVTHKYIFVNAIEGMDGTSEFSMDTARRTGNVSASMEKHGWKANKKDTGEQDKVDTIYLYKMSKCFLKSVKECLENIR